MERQNVTLSLPKALLKKAKTLAVNKGIALSDLLRGALEEKVKEESGYQRADLGTKGKSPLRGKKSMQAAKVFVCGHRPCIAKPRSW